MKKTSLLMAAAALSYSGMALAGADSGIYIGGALGSAQVDYEENDPDFGEISFDDSDSGYKIFAGYNLGIVPFLDLAIEGAYVDFGSQEGSVASVLGNKIDVTGWTGFGLAGFKLGPLGLFGKMGMIAWDSDVKFGGFKASDSGTDPAYGLGARFQLASLAVRAEWEIFDLDGVDIDYFSVGAAYTF